MRFFSKRIINEIYFYPTCCESTWNQNLSIYILLNKILKKKINLQSNLSLIKD